MIEAISLPRLLMAQLSEMDFSGPRARTALAAALAVGLAITLALALHLQDVYWAGISAFVCTRASQPQSLRKGFHRIFGTLAGATAALVFFPLVVSDHMATMLLLYCAGALGITGSLVSRNSYAWLLGGITAVMVILGAVDDPGLSLNIAFFRSSEIVLGTLAAFVIAKLLLPTGASIEAKAPGWASVFDARSHVLSHATRTGLAVAIVPVVWRLFELPDLTQMAISIGAVMAVPVLSDSHQENQRAVLRRSAQRLLGCCAGGSVGLIVLMCPWSASFPVWLTVLMIGAAVGSQMETGRHDVRMLGIQAEVALILTLTQGWGPALSLLPAIDRVVGMVGAVSLLAAIGLILGPERDAASVLGKCR